ncbi:MAG TPA: hypothetical protein VFR36_10370 [Sphingomicrobium sp.]|nr:hypothetical protein [Sphingomicrobium sp.]
MIEVVRFACSNWVITPAALAVNEVPPANIGEQRFILILSGVAVIAFEGRAPNWPWTHETVHIRPDINPALAHAIDQHQIPTPPGNAGFQFTREFQVEQIAPFAGVASFEAPAGKATGAACDAWRPHPYETRTDAFNSAPLPQLFAGIQADLAERTVGGNIHRVHYHVALIGKIRFGAVIIT